MTNNEAAALLLGPTVEELKQRARYLQVMRLKESFDEIFDASRDDRLHSYSRDISTNIDGSLAVTLTFHFTKLK